MPEKSLFVYLRQDPFKERIFIGHNPPLVILAQIVAFYMCMVTLG